MGNSICVVLLKQTLEKPESGGSMGAWERGRLGAGEKGRPRVGGQGAWERACYGEKLWAACGMPYQTLAKVGEPLVNEPPVRINLRKG
ncbi:MAG: hypothetical protein GTO18_22135 [Anaerolineales bacterium]|nr:hypothetical protein [Anaerolineales bacterium]